MYTNTSRSTETEQRLCSETLTSEKAFYKTLALKEVDPAVI